MVEGIERVLCEILSIFWIGEIIFIFGLVNLFRAVTISILLLDAIVVKRWVQSNNLVATVKKVWLLRAARHVWLGARTKFSLNRVRRNYCMPPTWSN